MVNRRTFEPPDYRTTISQARRDSMVTLAENRRIRLKLNLLRKDFQQYEFVQVRELAADTTRLVGDSVPRQALNVIVPADGTIEIALRPGSGSLLEIVYKQPAEAITGNLDYNNQHKMAYYKPPTSSWGRYYATYYKDTALYNPDIPDSLNPYRTTWTFLRRSLPVDTTGVIRWEPMEYALPISAGLTRIQNLHPALTLYPSGNDVVASVVWSCHSVTASDTLHREVVFRNVFFQDGAANGSFGQLEHVDDYYKNNIYNLGQSMAWTAWGTPVISRLSDSGFAILYSDATFGIQAKIRKRPGISTWWWMPGVYSAAVTVSDIYPYMMSEAGRFPTVPSFAHVGNRDSTTGFSWAQPTVSGRQTILYGRLAQGREPGNPAIPMVITNASTLRNVTFNEPNGRHYFPSMDQTQDPFGRIQEVIVWETPVSINRRLLTNQTSMQCLNLRSIWVEPTSLLGTPWLWGTNTVVASIPAMGGQGTDYAAPMYASIASTNDLTGVAVPDDHHAFFSIPYTTSRGMKQGTFRYTEDFNEKRILDYSFGGVFPQAATSQLRQVGRQGVLYQTGGEGDNPTMHTTRQFFARSAPTEYMAEGRALAMLVDDSATCSVHSTMFNAWYANDATAAGISLVARDTTDRIINTLPQAQALFRTLYFHSHDSTRIGLTVVGEFAGSDTTGRRVMVVAELMDSASNSVVYQVDSFNLSASSALYRRSIDTTFDLLSGTYFLRVRFDTANVSVPVAQYGSRYGVSEILSKIDGDGLGKVRREGAITSNHARISAQPNPLSGTTELRFSIPSAGDVAIRVFDPIGRPVAEVLPGQWMDAGRYAVGFDASQLPPGTYIVELMLGQQRVVEKMVVVR
ncbi:MAG: T9SS type A sorting domain-containing protein [Armatimonadetes bacterium]|nr:T9SS type A sorting domain-containing protein [Armatimonadota bacterium]